MFCPSCGKELADDAKFCIGCGAEINASLQSPEKPAETEPTTAAPSTSEPAPSTSEPMKTLDLMRLLVLASLLGAAFITFFNFGREVWFSAFYFGGAGMGFGDWMGFASGLIRGAIGYGYATPIIALLIAAGVFLLVRSRNEALESEYPGQGFNLIAIGIGMGGLFMLLSSIIGGAVVISILAILIGASQIFTALMLRRNAPTFTGDKVEKISYPVATYSLLVYGAFLALSGIGALTGLGFLAFQFPRIMMIIGGIGGLLGILGFAASIVLRKLGITVG